MKRLLFILLAASAMALQVPDGVDIPEDQRPLQCDNYRTTPVDHRCHCARDEQKCDGGLPQEPADVRLDHKCKTYCNHQHCQCAGHGCRS